MLYKIFVFKLTSRYNKDEVRFMNYIGKKIDDFKVKAFQNGKRKVIS